MNWLAIRKKTLNYFTISSFVIWAISAVTIYPQLFEKSSQTTFAVSSLILLVALIINAAQVVKFLLTYLLLISIFSWAQMLNFGPFGLAVLVFLVFGATILIFQIQEKKSGAVLLVDTVFLTMAISQLAAISFGWNLSILSSTFILACFYIFIVDLLNTFGHHGFLVKKIISDVFFVILILGIVIWLSFYQ